MPTTDPSPRPPLVAQLTSSLAEGRYGPGQEVNILVKYTAPVTVIGAPVLWLDLGDADNYAEFDGMSHGSNDTLLFVYFVREGLTENVSTERGGNSRRQLVDDLQGNKH